MSASGHASPLNFTRKHRKQRLHGGLIGLMLVFACIATLPAQSVWAKSPQSIAARGTWVQLSPQQQAVLAPLAGEWDKLPEINKQKWLQIAGRYPSMKPDAQQRLQSRMSEWAKMSPEQRRTARENYQVNKTIAANKKVEAWQDYQKLPPEQKNNLAAVERAQKKTSAVSAPPSLNAKLTKDANKVVHQNRNKAKVTATKPIAATPSVTSNTTPPLTPAVAH